MATNNAVNLKSSGIVSYDGSGVFSALANPLTVSNGGTGSSSLTAYAVLCGGTTSTGALQSIASVGTTGQVLTSNGAGALPTFQNAAGGGAFFFAYGTTVGQNLVAADSTTYKLAMGAIPTTSSNASTRIYSPVAFTITKVYVVVRLSGAASSENVTLFVRINGASDTNISTTSQWTANPTVTSNTSMSVSVSAGDYIEIGFTTPAWVTNPTNVGVSAMIYGS